MLGWPVQLSEPPLPLDCRAEPCSHAPGHPSLSAPCRLRVVAGPCHSQPSCSSRAEVTPQSARGSACLLPSLALRLRCSRLAIDKLQAQRMPLRLLSCKWCEGWPAQGTVSVIARWDLAACVRASCAHTRGGIGRKPKPRTKRRRCRRSAFQLSGCQCKDCQSCASLNAFPKVTQARCQVSIVRMPSPQPR